MEQQQKKRDGPVRCVCEERREYCHNIWYGKTRMVGIPDGEETLKIRLFISMDARTWWTERRTPHNGCTYAEHCIEKNRAWHWSLWHDNADAATTQHWEHHFCPTLSAFIDIWCKRSSSECLCGNIITSKKQRLSHHYCNKWCQRHSKPRPVPYCRALSNLTAWSHKHCTSILYWQFHDRSFSCFLIMLKWSSSSRMHVMNHNRSATKQCLHPQSVAEISHYSVLSGDRIRQCETLSGSRHKDTDQCL